MREVDGRTLPSRVRGRPVLERRIRGLLLAVARYGQHRAASAHDRLWACRVVDALRALLNDGR